MFIYNIDMIFKVYVLNGGTEWWNQNLQVFVNFKMSLRLGQENLRKMYYIHLNS